MVLLLSVFKTDNIRHIIRPRQLVVALSNGTIALYELSLGFIEAPQLRHLGDFQQYPNSTLVLSLAMDLTSALTIATLSTGKVSIVDVGMENLTSSRVWNAHNLEVWCSAWKTSDTILTGGDDALLKVWDLRQDHQTPQIVCKRYRIAGNTMLICIAITLVWFQYFQSQIQCFLQAPTTILFGHSTIGI
jgi:WD40 repeat protein